MPGDEHAPADARYMRRALELAQRGWGRVSPNPLVGAVVVRDGEIVGEGWHAEYGQAHAEVMALRAAGERARGATIYVTLEPCAHTGKTPPCTDALIAAGVARLVYACGDPNPRAGGGAAILAAHGVEVTGAVESEAASALNAAFFHAHRATGRPWLELKLALSLDGRMADHAGRSFWVTGAEARSEVHRLRAWHDAVAVGIGTALADDPLLTVRGSTEPRRPPVRVVFDRRLRLPLESRLVTGAREVPLWIVHAPDAPAAPADRLRAAGATLLEAADLTQSLRVLRERGLDSLFCEGGPQLAGALLRETLVDRLTLFFAPLLLGPGGWSPFQGLPDVDLSGAERWHPIRRAAYGHDTLISYER